MTALPAGLRNVGHLSVAAHQRLHVALLCSVPADAPERMTSVYAPEELLTLGANSDSGRSRAWRPRGDLSHGCL
jgi:hypothetical protein